MDGQTDQTAALESLGITSFFEEDERPTLVLDLSSTSKTNRLVYYNPAFSRFRSSVEDVLDRPEDDFRSLIEWACSVGAPTTLYGGRTWMAFTVKSLWRVVSCHDSFRSIETITEEDKVDGAGSFSLASSGVGDGEERAAKRSRSIASHEKITEHLTPSPSRASSASSSARRSSDGNKVIDWTSAPVSGLSPYVQFVKSYDWGSTPLGPMDQWPRDLKMIIVNIMSNPDPRLLLWGPEHLIVYNEACVPIIGQKHPCLGHGPKHAFAEIWEDIYPIVRLATHEGQTTKISQMPLTMDRGNGLEECFFTFTMIPIIGPDGAAVGAIDQFTEVTTVVVGERRMETILRVGENTAAAEDLDHVWNEVISGLDSNPSDFPYALLYSVTTANSEDHSSSVSESSSSFQSEAPANVFCRLEGTVGIDRDHAAAVANFDLLEESCTYVKILRRAWKTRKQVVLDRRHNTIPEALVISVPGRGGGVPNNTAVVLPVTPLVGRNIVAFLILGISARRPYDDDYKLYLNLLNDRIIHSAAAVFLPKEQRQLQQSSEESALRHAALSRQLLLRTQEAELSEAKFTRMAERVPVGMYLVKNDGTPIYLNEAYCKLLGIDKYEQVNMGPGAEWRETVVPEDIPAVEKSWVEIIDSKIPSRVEFRVKRVWKAVDKATGAEMEGPTWLLSSAFPDVDGDGVVRTVMGWVTDISLQKWTENLQTKRLEEALESKRQSESFIDLVSHEMRNPLSAILQSADGILTALKEMQALRVTTEDDDEPYDEAFETTVDGAQTIVLCAQHQKRIVDDILTFSKLDSSLIVLCPEITHPRTLVDRAYTMFQSELNSAGIDAVVSVDPLYEDAAVVCDPSRVLQILINLLTNAIKFTRNRRKRIITISLQASTAPPSTFHENVAYIPRRESRPQASFTEEWGSGEEVYLVFSVQDTGRGLTEKEMEVLFHRFSQASPRTHAQYGGSGLGLFISKELTELQGGQIGVASTYGEGSLFTFYVKALHHVPGEPRRRVSETPARVPSWPDAASFSANNVAADGLPRQPSPDVPAPTLGLRSSAAVALAREIPAVKKSDAAQLHVLIVEDNVINQKVMAKGLKSAGCVVHVANHGGEAIEFLRHSTYAPQNLDAEVGLTPLSVILMDLEMPIMNGVTAIRKIREMENNGELRSRVPVAAVTANARGRQVADALQHGMDIVVTKPFRIPELLPKMLALASGELLPNHDPVYTYAHVSGGDNNG